MLLGESASFLNPEGLLPMREAPAVDAFNYGI
jgi:hypothetical protein